MSYDDPLKDITKTAELRTAAVDGELSHKRAIADIISTLEDKAWLRGWLIGFTSGVAIVAILYGLYTLVVYG